MRYRWILFDADGTLFDFAKAEDIYRQARPAKAELRRSLQKLLV